MGSYKLSLCEKQAYARYNRVCNSLICKTKILNNYKSLSLLLILSTCIKYSANSTIADEV